MGRGHIGTIPYIGRAASPYWVGSRLARTMRFLPVPVQAPSAGTQEREQFATLLERVHELEAR